MMSFVGSVFNGAVQAAKYPFVGWGEPSQQQILQKALFARGAALPQIGAPTLSGHTINSTFVVSDYTTIYRSTEDFIMSCLDLFPSHSLGWLKNMFSGKDAAIVYSAFGLSSGLNAILGAVQLKRDFENIAFSDAITDSKGSLMGRASVVKDGALIGGGLSFAAFRSLSILDTVKGITPGLGSASLTGRATYGMLFVGIILYSIFFAFFAVIAGLKMHEGAKFKGKLKNAKNLQEQIDILQKKLNVDPKSVLAKLEKKHGSEAARKILIEEAMASGKEGLQAVMKELGLEELSEDKLKALLDKSINAVFSGRNVEEKLVQVGLSLKVQKAELKKQSKLGRILTKEALAAMHELKSDTNLSGRIGKADAKAIARGEALVEAIQKGAASKLKENAVLLAVFVFGIIALAGVLAFTGGAGLLVASALMLLFSLVSLAVDGYYLAQSYKAEKPGSGDKKMLIASTVLAVATILIIAALVASGVFTMGTFPMIAALVLAVLWLGQNGMTWAVMNRNEKLHQEKNPTLETLIEALKREENQARILKMLENLPEPLKHEVESQRKAASGDLLRGALAVSKKVEDVRKARLDILREALVPMMVRC